MLFGTPKTVSEVRVQDNSKVEALEKQIADTEHAHKIEIAELQSDHKLALKDKEFELKHFKDEEVQKLNKELDAAKRDNAVLKKENEMLTKITDLNSDVIDVKELVTSLIEKLPEVKISSLSIAANKE